jgi:eukaryotic-like serine/threonine-protein kinase
LKLFSKMPAPASIDELLDLIRKSGVMDDKRLDVYMEKLRTAAQPPPANPAALAALMTRDGLVTGFQAEQLMLGKWRRFSIGKYKVLERLGSGGMGSVFLCEHKFMRRRVAVKVLPTAKAADPSSLQRFYQEARAVAALDHPNIVHAYDIDQDENLHFLVMEYVDGPSLQEMVRRSGPLSVVRACHYISQSAEALDHANSAGLVHRDIKPGNILVDRVGVVKILDMGLARFFHDDEEDSLTRKFDENVLGTADYLAPEQADDSHTVDIRADIYSLGGTFYFLLTGKTPFGDGSVPQKLMWHRTRQPKAPSSYRNDIPPELEAVLDKMMAKEPGQRYSVPAEIMQALSPWTQEPIPPPPESEMPQLSPAVTGSMQSSGGTSSSSSGAKKAWKVTGAPATNPPSSASGTGQPQPTQTATAVSTKPVAPPRPPARQVVSAPGPTQIAQSSSRPVAKPRPSQSDTPGWGQSAPETPNPAAKETTPSRPIQRQKPPAAKPVPPKPKSRLAWTPLDITVAVVAAAGVLLLSALALIWLFRT